MKTFKLVGLKIERNEGKKRIEEVTLVDGLVINKDDGENSWLIEALIPSSYQSFFENYVQSEQETRLFITISKKSNSPAPVIVRVKSITELDKNISILLEGRMLSRRFTHDPRELLSNLMSQGLTGETLLQAFRTGIHETKKDEASS
ncbi:YwpF family protein [Metabacillus fastidiosus]|uniref:YwpF family protein n=1 Tax=Metabacillus fastidiosus TaxID=1458 RepID=A0ABU6P5E9_9BACI|nr:YwpF family protein [Metabacillus fastidiosus]MEC2076049.1 YwpF family protein [Metabacillus fastidiosus]MED4403907.1 YwpF family protein [Metabacillus fastidiosus]MED4456000.1 YwpF family protein [Metabacillus fastidiosus]MED4464451.1 YwpF family protein [Metabacillus fastidiosus]MED4534455.1 YwpF family protein [Metabacillus fastidiosus]